MRPKFKVLLAGGLALILGAVSLTALLYYTYPTDDQSFDLSLLSDDAQPWQGEKGWTVYINEQGQVKELVSDGSGGYSGLSYPGQTFYFSREMKEALDSPTLWIGTVNRTISVFLDESLIYTDCPNLENRIGWLELPMLNFDRTEPVVVSLPPDYLGRTLTIAQSTPLHSEKQVDDGIVYPSSVVLYCGYSYESGLIAETTQITIPAALLFALELLLLFAFVWKASQGKIVLSLLFLALATLFQMSDILVNVPFSVYYLGEISIDLVWLFFYLAIGALLAFLTVRSSYFRPFLICAASLHWISTLISALVQIYPLIEYGDLYLSIIYFPQITGMLALLAALICSFLQWRRGVRFFRFFSQTTLIILGCSAIFLLLSSVITPSLIRFIFRCLRNETILLLPNLSLKFIWAICLVSGIAALIIELFEQETQRRTELSILASRNKLATESYENLRRQSEEVMMLRHDITKHYILLRTMSTENPGRLPDYLDELIGQIQQVRPVVACGNQILDILINSRLHTAAQKGIHTEIIRSEAPPKLPLTDANLCSLVTNILDNAITAASAPDITDSYIKLDFHCKGEHFVFSCENSMSVPISKHKKTPMPGHGYGLKIIHQIMHDWGDMVSIESNGKVYKLSIAIPLR